MHAFILTNTNQSDVKKLSEKLKAKIIEFRLQKIQDTRILNKFLRLTTIKPTLILIKNIQEATEEALNAFLKNLEEPQENIYFALTTSNIHQVLSTIVSRCQIIKNSSTVQHFDSDKIERFLNTNIMQKLDFVSKIKDRTEALKFVEDLMRYLQNKKKFDNLELVLKTYTRLKANGNVNLQLSNLSINYE